jgi:hypothetical protein
MTFSSHLDAIRRIGAGMPPHCGIPCGTANNIRAILVRLLAVIVSLQC